MSRGNTDTVCSPCRRAVGVERSAPPDGSNLADVLKAYRALHKLKQQDLANLLGYDQSYVSLLERGKRNIRDMVELRRLAHALSLPEGLLPPAEAVVMVGASAGEIGERSPLAAVDDQRRWRMTRRELNRHRADLTKAAARLYPDVSRAGNSPVLTHESWMWPEPVDFADIELAWLTQTSPPEVRGREKQVEGVRPLAPHGAKFDRYTQAIRMIDRPSLFVNRPSFRLLDVTQMEGRPKLSFGYTTYFDMADVCEGVAHELASAWAAGRPPHFKMNGDG
ncbi:helix-turn-helix domain-containing protein [Streptomyces virginiae]|uniref:helix-turn-helix domain-containing protein n=1 Tax=Streptomyces virginiae TaxID=1961 RepID=UPI0036B8393E